MQRNDAETVGLQALAWLLSNDELLPVFMGSTGMSGTDLRERATDSDVLGAVLDFVNMDDAWVTAFCDAQGYEYTRPAQARAALPGGDLPHWT